MAREGAARQASQLPAFASPWELRAAGEAARERAALLRVAGGPSALSSNWVFALCPSFSSVLPPSPTPLDPRYFPPPSGASRTPHVGRALVAQACSQRPLNASSPKTPTSKRSSSQTLPRAGKRQPAASSSRGSIPAPVVRPGARRRPRARHPPPGLRASGSRVRRAPARPPEGARLLRT